MQVESGETKYYHVILAIEGAFKNLAGAADYEEKWRKSYNFGYLLLRQERYTQCQRHSPCNDEEDEVAAKVISFKICLSIFYYFLRSATQVVFLLLKAVA